MAKSIILRYSNKALDTAIRQVARIKKGLKEAIAAGDNVFENVGKLGDQEELGGLLQARRLREQGRGGLRGRLGGGAPGFLANARAGFNRIASSGFRSADIASGVGGLSALRSLGTGTFTSGAAFGASLLGGPVGAAASVAIQLAALVQETIGPLIEKENQIQRELIMADVRRQLDERLEELAFDPGGNSLRQQRIRKAFADEARRDVAAGRDAAWSPVSARLSDL